MEDEDISSKIFMLQSVVEKIKEELAPNLKTRHYEFLIRGISYEESRIIDNYLIKHTPMKDIELPSILNINIDINNLLNKSVSEDSIISILEGYSSDKVLPIVDRILKVNKLY